MRFAKIKLFWQESYLLVSSHNMNCMSAQLTYAVITTIVPFFTVLFAFIQSRKDFLNILDDVINPFIRDNFGAGIGEEIAKYIRSIVINVQVTELNIVSLVSLLVTVILTLLLIESIFNIILDAKIKKNYFISLLKCWLLLACSPFLFVLFTLRSEFLSAIFNFANKIFLVNEITILRIILGYGSTTLFFSLLYFVMPSRHPKFIAALFGGCITTIILDVMRYINIFLVKQAISGSPNQIYGSVALVAILFFVWLRLILLMILIGFVFTTSFERAVFSKNGNGLIGKLKHKRK